MPKEIPINFESPVKLSRFKRILGQMSVVTTETAGNRSTFKFRPKNLFAFEQKLHKAGFKDCPVANIVIQYLVKFPNESLMIVVER